jgi:Alpha amylase, catalytic domain
MWIPAILLDPYGRGVVVPGNYSRDSACKEGENTATGMKSVVVDPRAYDWEKDKPLNRPWSRTIIYEMHVRGFTRHPSSNIPEERRGTFAGLIEKIPYLQQLGITAIELLPVFQFDAQDCPLGSSTIGATHRSPSLRRTKPTALAGTGSARWMSSVTWSRHCTGRESKSPLREVAHRSAPSPRRRTRTRASEPEPTHP